MSYRNSTSRPAYNEALQTAQQCRAQVLEAIKALCKINPGRRCYDRQIASYLGWEINRVTPRRNELLSAKLIEECGDFPNDNGRKVAHWKMPATAVKVEQANLFNDKAA